MYHEYLANTGRLNRFLLPAMAHWLRVWGHTSAERADTFITESDFVASFILMFYRRDFRVVSREP